MPISRFLTLLVLACLWRAAPAFAQVVAPSTEQQDAASIDTVPADTASPDSGEATQLPEAAPEAPAEVASEPILESVPLATEASAEAPVEALVDPSLAEPAVDVATDIAVIAPPPEPAPDLIPPPLDLVATPLAPALAAAPPPVLTSLQHEQLPGMCLSLSGPGGESESRPCDGSATQAFVLPGAEGGPIMQGTRCLAPKGRGSYPQLFALVCDASSEQFWRISANGDIRNAAGRCLSLLGASSRTGERIYAGECPATLPAHHWRAVVVDAAMSHPMLANIEFPAQPGKCLGNDGALGIVDCGQRLGRVFSLDLGGPSQFRLMSSCLASGYVFDGLSLSQCWDMPALKWSLTPDAQLVNGNGKCIAAVYENGRYVLRTADCQPVPEQQWKLVEVQP